MMELDDVSIKEPEDILAAIQRGASKADVKAMCKVHGERFTLLMVDAFYLHRHETLRVWDLSGRLLTVLRELVRAPRPDTGRTLNHLAKQLAQVLAQRRYRERGRRTAEQVLSAHPPLKVLRSEP